MTVVFVCPECGKSEVADGLPHCCSHCHSLLPEQLLVTLKTALASEKPARPLLITIGLSFFALWSSLFLFLMILAPFDVASYSIGDESVSGREFLRRAGLPILAVGVAALIACYGTWRERKWGRQSIIAFWLVFLVAMTALGWQESRWEGALSAVGSSLVPLGILPWYLFGKRNVVAYYRAAQCTRRASFKWKCLNPP